MIIIKWVFIVVITGWIDFFTKAILRLKNKTMTQDRLSIHRMCCVERQTVDISNITLKENCPINSLHVLNWNCCFIL